jgi:hypothetical protein
LIKCGPCGGGFSKVSQHHYGCSNARNRGTYDNRLTIRRDVLEASVLAGLKTHQMQPELVKEFAAEYHRELNRLNATRESAYARQQEELARVQRQLRRGGCGSRRPRRRRDGAAAHSAAAAPASCRSDE